MIPQLKLPNPPDDWDWCSENLIEIYFSDSHLNDDCPCYTGKEDSPYFWERDLKESFIHEFVYINTL
jgi:hypothetical protein